MTEPAVSLARIAQIGLTVDDLDAARPFYRDVLGLRLLFDTPGMLLFQVGDHRLILGLPEGEKKERFSSILYFEVAAIDAAHAALAARGVPFRELPHLVHRGPGLEVWIATLSDPSGNALALIEERRVDG